MAVAGRLDSYESLISKITRYYSIPENAENLDFDARDALARLSAKSFNVFITKRPLCPERVDIKVKNSKVAGLPYVEYSGKRLFLRRDFDQVKAVAYLNSLLEEQDLESPHRYLAPGFEVGPRDVVLDIGAAEANFSLDVIDRASRVFIFEGDQSWIEPLRATFEPFDDKVTIIGKYVGKEGIDPFIAEYPELARYLKQISLIKMDVEGAELNVLKGLRRIIKQNDPLRLLVCAYHRQGDEARIIKCLGPSFSISHSEGYMLYPWINGEITDTPPYFRRGVLRAEKVVAE